MPVAMAVFFAARLSFAPVLRMIPFADLLAFFDEDLDFLRLAFFMDSSRSTGFVQLGSFLRSVARTVSPAYRERGPAADGNPRYAPSAMSIRSALLSFAKTKPSLSRRGSALHLCHCRSRGGARSVPARYTSPCAALVPEVGLQRTSVVAGREAVVLTFPPGILPTMQRQAVRSRPPDIMNARHTPR
jgi:hypothetical protein